MNFSHVFQLLICCTLVQLCTLNQATAQNSPTLNIQGVLRNSNETAVENGIYQINFSLYTVETGGTAVWSETQDSVVVNGGVYRTSLGKKTPLNAAFDQLYYLGISVGSGEEMTPRVLLSSAPYALSLIGQSNTFPSSGSIGAGTNTPAAGYQLHAFSNNDAKILVQGSPTAQLELKRSNSDYFATMGLADGGYFDINARGDSRIKWNGDTRLLINGNGVTVNGTFNAPNFNFSPQDLGVPGYVSVGDNNPANNSGYRLAVRGATALDGFVYVTGADARTYSVSSGSNYSADQGFGLAGYGAIKFVPGLTATFVMDVNGWMRANSLYCLSDSRIKKNLSRSEGVADLDVLRKLQVTNYQHIDTLGYGSKFKKGFIAQEVKKEMENAVTISSDFIPNIFTVSKNIKLADSKLTVTLDKNHGLEVGDQVKLYHEKEEKVKVVAVPAANTFVVEWNTPTPKEEKIFVYGKAVVDFHSVDYDQIFTLNVSANQELARQLEQLKKKNEALKLENDTLKAVDEKIESRLRMLESKLNNN